MCKQGEAMVVLGVVMLETQGKRLWWKARGNNRRTLVRAAGADWPESGSSWRKH